MLYKNRTIMKTKSIIVLYLIIFLTGVAMNTYSQGIDNSGGFVTASSTNYIKLSGSSDMTISGTTADQTTLGNVAIDFTGTGTYKLTIPNDSYVSIDGNLTLADSLLLEANSSSSMASLITNGTVKGAYGIVEQHIVQDQWHMVSSPVSAAQSIVYTDCYLYKWNEPDSTWAFITTLTEPLTVAKGFHLWSSSSAPTGPTDVEFTGLLNTGNYSPTITYNAGSNKGDGWNELGNPYPSALEWNSSWTKSNVDATVYMYDGTQYKTWNYLLPMASTLPNGEIPSTQGFWVKANAASPSITIPNAERVHSSNTFYKGGDELQDMFKINVSGNAYADEMIIGMFSDATDDFDSEYDAYKLMGIEAAPQLYSYGNGTKYAVNLFNEITEDKAVPLGFRAGADAEYTFEAEGLEDFDTSIDVYLEDKSAGSMINLRENPVYVFYAENGLDEDRFVLHFGIDVAGTGQNVADNNINIYSFGDVVFVNYQLDVPGHVIVYDVLGKEIMSEALGTNQLNKLTVNNGRGYYIVKVISETNIETKKVLIN
ncbi:MAG: hypothetical protein DRJ05_05905 [Bacteroidetes bacterium]|nr:MAG: hypothetical protein DRJ05_05905 [Bacteroidota bacterium]